MSENNSSKKILLTVIGISVLVIAFVGVAFAFFNYTRTGSSNNIKVGRISFVSKNEETITLSNIFPIDPSNASDMNDSTKVGTYSIEIKGDTDYVDGIEYLVSVVDANIYTNQGQAVPISLDVTVTDLGTASPNYFTAREAKNATIYKKLVGDTLVGDQMVLVGYIKPNTTSGTAEGVDGNITIKAYLDKNKILISDTYDGSESDNMGTTNSMAEGKTVLTTSEWNALENTGVSFKIKVEANEGIWVIGSLEEIMKTKTVMDNITSTYVSRSGGIDFSRLPGDSDNNGSIDNGKGVYTRAGTENDTNPIMYYRGPVEDNNVMFANKCWKAVRTTDTGGVKLIYNGTPTNTYSPFKTFEMSDYKNVVTPVSSYIFDSTDNTWTLNMNEEYVSSLMFKLPTGSNYSMVITGTTDQSTEWEYEVYKNYSTDIAYNYGEGGEVINDTITLGSVLSTDIFELDFYTLDYPENPLSIKVKVLQDGIPLNEEDYTTINYGFTFDNNEKKWYSEITSNSQATMKFTLDEAGDYLFDFINPDNGLIYYYVNGKYVYNTRKTSIMKFEDMHSGDIISLVYYSNTVTVPFSFSFYKAEFSGYGCENIDDKSVINENNMFVFDYVSSTQRNPGYVGYMHGTSYIMRSGNTGSGVYYGSSLTWDGTNYSLVDPTTTRDDYHHYTCNLTTANGTCSSIRYYYCAKDSSSTYYYLNLTGGESIEDALTKMYTNTIDSDAKSTVDTWYVSNMESYTNRLEDTIWCSDRSTFNNHGWKPVGGNLETNMYYGPRGRSTYGDSNYEYKNKPSLECVNKNDRFTVSNNKGNKALTYPVALLTSDEEVLAGNITGGFNSTSYLNIEYPYWTMSPYQFVSGSSYVFLTEVAGNVAGDYTNKKYGLRPTISIKPGQLITKGTGTAQYPYVIE